MNKSHNMSQLKIALPVQIDISSDLRKRRGDFNPWELRDAFLAWPVENWEAFGKMTELQSERPITKEQFARFQKLFREALVLPAKEWHKIYRKYQDLASPSLAAALRPHFDFWADLPKAHLSMHGELHAMLTTIKLDKLLGAEFRVCARPDCQNAPFRVGTRQKEFCSYDCAHLMAVRRSRQRAAAAKKTDGKSAKPKGRR
jgi:hypothetical protein